MSGVLYCEPSENVRLSLKVLVVECVYRHLTPVSKTKLYGMDSIAGFCLAKCEQTPSIESRYLALLLVGLSRKTHDTNSVCLSTQELHIPRADNLGLRDWVLRLTVNSSSAFMLSADSDYLPYGTRLEALTNSAWRQPVTNYRRAWPHDYIAQDPNGTSILVLDSIHTCWYS